MGADEDLRAMFLEQACEAWSDALDDATWAHVGMLPESAARHRRWEGTTPEQREVTVVAMSAFLDWVDARRLP